MTKAQLEKEANRFRQAIEDAKAAGEFKPDRYKSERMNNFPHDCCDDAADLFTHYLFQKYKIDSIRIDGEYYDEKIGHCAHSWQVTDGWLIDLTGDQFETDSASRALYEHRKTTILRRFYTPNLISISSLLCDM